ncbi:MAG: zinc ribbon domain-containing protein [Candidatus Heimdallarchaeota archaeon]
MSEYKYCSSCGGRVKRTAKFCGHCGKSISKKQPQPAKKEAVPSEGVVKTLDAPAGAAKDAKTQKCPNCGSTNDEDARFCKNCAALL